MCFSAFAGCSLVERNNEKYLNATVATIEYDSGAKEKISKRELLTAYNSYGYNYVSNGATAQEAVEKTIDSIVDRKLTVKAVKDYYAKNGGEELTAAEKTYLWDQTYSSMYSNLKSYFDDINSTPATEDEEEAEEASKSVFVQFKRSVYFDYVQVGTDDKGTADEADDEPIMKLVIMKDSIADSIRRDYKSRVVGTDVVDFELEKDGAYPFKESLYNKLMSTSEGSSEGAKIWQNAINNYIADVKENYEHEKFNSNKDAFMFEIERVYKILKENYYVEKYSDIYNGQESNFTSNITVEEILNNYSKSVRDSYQDYELEGKDFNADVLSKISSVNYIKEDSNFFYLSYIKFEIDTQLLETYKKQLERKEIVQAQYDLLVEGVYNNAHAKIRNAETGELTGQTMKASDLKAKIDGELEKEYWTVEKLSADAQEKLNAAELGMTDEQYVNYLNEKIAIEKAEILRPYLYLYNADETYKGVDYNAVFGADNSGNILAGDTFAEKEDVLLAIKNLYKAGSAKIGESSQLVNVEDDGVYLFFYVGDVENVFPVADENFDISRNPEAIRTLADTRLNIFSNKTIFDKLYAEATKNTYSVFETLNMHRLRNETKKIEIVENQIKDLY